MKLIIILAVLLVGISGCLSPQIPTGNPSQYELPGLFNTTIFYLDPSVIKVVASVNNTKDVYYQLEDSIEDFKYPVAVDRSGNNRTMNVSIIKKLSKNYAYLNFSSNFSGFVAYSKQGTQDFTFFPAADTGMIRVVLPVNFTAGGQFIGFIQPAPSNVTHDASGREVIIWDNPQQENIRVRYHQIETTRFLFYIFIVLFISAIIVWVYFHFSIRSLVRKREMLEKGKKK